MKLVINPATGRIKATRTVLEYIKEPKVLLTVLTAWIKFYAKR